MWIDDDAARRLYARSLGKNRAKIDAQHPVEIADATDGLNNIGAHILDRGYEAVVLDYDLSRTASSDRKHFSGRAPRVLGAIRDQEAKLSGLGTVPVFLISAHWNKPNRGWDYVGLSQFDALISERDLHRDEFESWLSQMTHAFRRLRRLTNGAHSVDVALANKIAAPPADASDDFAAAAAWQIDRFAHAPVVPTAFLEHGQTYAGTVLSRQIPVLEFVRWLRNRFMRLPGALLDTNRAAVFLGMTPQAFARRGKYFANAQYRGLFSDMDTQESLWWRAALEQTVMRRSPSGSSAPTVAALSRLTFKLSSSETAWCAVSKREGIQLEAEVLAYPADVDIFSPDSDGLLTPVARSRASADPEADLPVPFDRVYRFASR